jgi:hypothetical protein
MFTQQKITVQSNQIRYETGTRKPVSGYADIATSIPCRITGIDNEKLNLFILEKYYILIPGGIHKGFKIILEDTNPIVFEVKNEPFWAGGIKHHMEILLEEFK